MPLHRFRPRLLDALKTYDGAQFGRDLGAGLTVGIVALPLAMAFAIASGVKPEAGIFTAIIAGFLISALGGSTVQIGGPAGAFIVIIYGIVERYGLANLLIATSLAGVLLFLMGLFKLGFIANFLSHPVIVGFTNAAAIIIALSQASKLFGVPMGRSEHFINDIVGVVTGAPGSKIGSCPPALPSSNRRALRRAWRASRPNVRRSSSAWISERASSSTRPLPKLPITSA